MCETNNSSKSVSNNSGGDDVWFVVYDADTDEYLTECGLEVDNQTAHGILTGVTA